MVEEKLLVEGNPVVVAADQASVVSYTNKPYKYIGECCLFLLLNIFQHYKDKMEAEGKEHHPS